MVSLQLDEIIRRFKEECELKGWKISELEDWVEFDNEYHNFIWTRTVNLATFMNISAAQKCAIRDGRSYRVVDVAYTAWLLSEPSIDELIRALIENPTIAERTAVYNLKLEHLDRPIYRGFNGTDSKVFHEFESFLETKLGSESQPREEAMAQHS